MAKYRCRIGPHGPLQIEMKIRYPVGEQARPQYNLDLYMFFPAQLRVSRDCYGSRSFIDDVLSHIRHTSPRISLAELADAGAESPLAAVEASLAAGGEADSGAVLRELRTLGNAFRSAIRSERSALLRLAGGSDAAAVADRLRSLLADLARFRARQRPLPEAFGRSGLAQRLQDAAIWADEWISLNAEVELVRVWEALRGCGAASDLLDELRARAREEVAYRRKAGHPSVMRPGDAAANERAVHRESLLKKWSQGALYMSSEQLATSKGIGHIVAGVAAAAAMTFAVAATFLATRLFPSNSIPWALMVVVSYIFKDRIKEILRGSLGRFFPLLFFDRSGRLDDPSVRRPVGTTRETVRFCRPSDCPQEVVDLRSADGNPFREVMPPDSVIHYNKIIKLRSDRLRAAHAGLDSITEILRMKIDPWLREMDDPVSRKRMLWGGSVATIAARRVYHVHMILRLWSRGGSRSLQHYRAVLSRSGVERIEAIGRPRAGPAAAGGSAGDELYGSAASSRE